MGFKAQTYNLDEIKGKSDLGDYISAEESVLLSAFSTTPAEDATEIETETNPAPAPQAPAPKLGTKKVKKEVGPAQRAKSKGFFKDKGSWIHFLTENIDFSVNGTPFKGKAGYQVRGNSIPIGKGLSIDMAPVTLIGSELGNAAEIDREGSLDPRLIFFSPMACRMVQIPMHIDQHIEDFRMSEDHLEVESDVPFKIPYTESVEVEAQGFLLREDGMEIKKPVAAAKDATGAKTYENLREAQVTDEGLELYSDIAGSVVQNIGSMAQQGGQTPLGASQVPSQTPASADTQQDIVGSNSQGPAASNVSTEGTNTASHIEADSTNEGSENGSDSEQIHEGGDDQEEENPAKPPTLTQEEREDLIDSLSEQRVISASSSELEEIKKPAKSSNEDKGDDGDGGDGGDGGDDGDGGDGKEGSDTEEKKTDETGEEKEKSDAELEEDVEVSTLEYIKAFMDGDTESVAGARLAYAKNALKTFFKGEKLPEPSKSEMTALGLATKEEVPESENKTLPDIDFKVLIFPGLYGYVALEPSFKFGFEHDHDFSISFGEEEGIKGLGNIVKEDVIEAYNKGKAGETGPDAINISELKAGYRPEDWMKGELVRLIGMVKLNADVMLGLTGELNAKVSLGLEAGENIILGLRAGLFANLNLAGAAENEDFENSLIYGKLHKEIGFKDGVAPKGIKSLPGMIEDGDTEIDVKAGIKLTGDVGAEGTLTSKLFGVNKELGKIVFGEWTIGQLQYGTRLTLPSISSGGKFFDLKQEESTFNVSLFNREIVNTGHDKYGFRFTKKNKQMADLFEDSAKEDKEYTDLSDKMDKEEGFDDPEKLSYYIDCLTALQFDRENLIRNIDELIAFHNGDEDYQNDLEKAQQMITEHQSRLESLQRYATEHHLSEKQMAEDDKDNTAFKHYKENIVGTRTGTGIIDAFGLEGKMGIGMEQSMADENHTRAENEIATRERLLLYEKARLDEVTLKQSTRVKELEAKLSELGIGSDNMGERNDEFLDWYKDFADEELLSRHVEFADVDTLLDYERFREAQVGAKHQERINKLQAKIKELKIEDKMDEGNQKLIDYYSDELGAKEMLNRPVQNFLSVDEIIAYERGKALENKDCAEKWKMNNAMRDFKKKYDAAGSEEEKAEITKKARDIFFGVKDEKKKSKKSKKEETETTTDADGELYNFNLHYTISDITKRIEYVADTQELLDYEKSRKKEKEEKDTYEILAKGIEAELEKGHGGKDYVKDALSGESAVKINQMCSEQLKKINENSDFYQPIYQIKHYVNNVGFMDKWKRLTMRSMMKDAAQDKENESLITENASISAILLYEQGQMANSSKDAEVEKHRKRVNELARWVTKLSELENPDAKAKQEAKLREYYFSGKMDRDLKINLASKATPITDYIEAIQKNELKTLNGHHFYDPKVLVALLRAKNADSDITKEIAKHDVRIKNIEAQIKEGASFEDIYASYQQKTDAGKGGGAGFTKAERKKKTLTENDITIDQMCDFSKQKLREASVKGVTQRAWSKVKNFVASKAPKMSGLDKEKMAQVLYGGHLKRYESLMNLKESIEQREGMSSEEIHNEVVNCYCNDLQAGRGLDREVKENLVKFVTPNKILEYERTRRADITKKHTARIEMLEGYAQGDEEKRKEAGAAYREMAKHDGEGIKDRANYFISLFYKKYKTGADKKIDTHMTLTPEVILKVEKEKLEEDAKKHRERVAMLKNKSMTNEEAWRKYKDMGGGKQFLKEYASSVKQAEGVLNKTNYRKDTSMNSMMAYEKKRIAYYEEQKAIADAPVRKLQELKNDIIGKQASTIERLAELRKLKEALKESSGTPSQQTG